MKVVLLNPYRERSDHVAPDLGLGYLAAWTRKAGHDITLIDPNNARISREDLHARLLELGPEVVGIKVFTQDLSSARETFKFLRVHLPSAVLVAGGAHPSAVPEQVLNTLPEVDYAFRGEAEIGFARFLDFLCGSCAIEDVPGLIWRDGSGIRINDQVFIKNLDELGIPAWDLIDPRDYSDTAETFRKAFPAAPISITRGCPFPCTYCAGHIISGKPIRSRSIEHVLNEMQYLMTEFGVKEFNIVDDNFTHNRAVVESFCRGIIDRKLDISWSGSTGIRLDSLDEELLGLMRRSGCYSFYVGIESGSQRILDLMKKHLTLDKIRQGVQMINRSGIDVSGFFIIGFPGETRNDIIDTIAFAAELPLFKAHFFHFTALPATEAYDSLATAGKIAGFDDSMFMDVSYVPDGMTPHELKSLLRKAYLTFYLRPAVISRLLLRLGSARQLRLILKKMINYFFNTTAAGRKDSRV
ncbi:MAG: radical SAM protein [Geobacteraceae bacterium]|nr:radical SAM protein [Geobacteraceae bacterium]